MFGGESILLTLLTFACGWGWAVRVCVFVQPCVPSSRSALYNGLQATRWRSDSAVSPEPPFLTDLTTRGPPEGRDILLTDHNTQTNPSMTLSASFHQEAVYPERLI